MEPAVFLVLALPILNWCAAVVLTGAHRRRPGLRWLRERAIAAWLLALAATAGVIVYLDGVRPDSLLNGRTLEFAAVIILTLMSAPAVYWLWLYVAKGPEGRR